MVVRTGAIAPGFVMTSLLDTLHEAEDVAQRVDEAESRLPVGRVGRPDEPVSAALLFMTDGFLTGQGLVLDGGLLETS